MAGLRGADSPFIYMTCQLGAEPALKGEVAANHPELHFAFSRPGFLTFKWTGEPAKFPGLDFEQRTVFGRTAGVSLGKLTGESAAVIAGQLQAELPKILPGDRKIRLHVWERDLFRPDEEPLGFVVGERAAKARGSLQAVEKRFEQDPVARDGETVLDVIVIEEGEWWIGLHRQRAGISPHPGARPPLLIPAEAPSRAWRKLEEAIHWSGAPILPGDIAVEVGSAPGGASYALLQRGVKVMGVDPAEMAPQVLKHPNFRHIRLPVGSVPREEMPEHVDWLLMDMNVAPSISLFAVDRLATRMKDSLLGLLLTVKLNQWKLAREIPGMLEHVKVMGMARVRATQLPSNRQEIFVYGLTRKGMARLKAK